MSPAIISEKVDRRVLGGFLFADAVTSESIVKPLVVSNTPLKLRLNRSGVYAIFDAPGFSSLKSAFDLPPGVWPAAGQAFEITVRDPGFRYLPRRAAVQAPQSLATLGTPQRILLYPTPAGDVEPNWALVRATVTGSGGAGLKWAVLQAIRSDNSIAATGMTDARGEGLLALSGLGVQVSSSDSGSVTESTIPITIRAWFDPAVLQQTADWVPNPDDILGTLSNPALKTGSVTGALGAGQIFFAGITISV
jgi:hypothetical protein